MFSGVGEWEIIRNTLRSQKKKKKKKVLKIINYFPCFQNFMINRENLIKIGRAGDNTTNRETLDQIVRVVMSVYASELDVESDRFENINW